MAIQFRTETEAMWEFLNPILLRGEPATVSGTPYTKIGDGIHHWVDLPWIKMTRADLEALLDEIGSAPLTPRQLRVTLTEAQDTFPLTGIPNGGVVLFSLNGLLQHEATVVGGVVTINPAALTGDDILITWFET